MRSPIRSRSNSARAREDVEDQLAARGRRVDVLLQALEADAVGIERVRTVSIKCVSERPSRSSFHTTSVSPART